MKPARLRADVLAGLTTSFVLVPECIAFALVAHLNLLMGLYGAFILCTLTALFGGSPGMVSGAAGSMAVVIVALVLQHGVQYLLATVMLGGLVMILFGLLRLGKLVRMVPHPVMLGFVNGLAIVIALAQLEHFKDGEYWLSGNPPYVMVGLVAQSYWSQEVRYFKQGDILPRCWGKDFVPRIWPLPACGEHQTRSPLAPNTSDGY